MYCITATFADEKVDENGYLRFSEEKKYVDIFLDPQYDAHLVNFLAPTHLLKIRAHIFVLCHMSVRCTSQKDQLGVES